MDHWVRALTAMQPWWPKFHPRGHSSTPTHAAHMYTYAPTPYQTSQLTCHASSPPHSAGPAPRTTLGECSSVPLWEDRNGQTWKGHLGTTRRSLGSRSRAPSPLQASLPTTCLHSPQPRSPTCPSRVSCQLPHPLAAMSGPLSFLYTFQK